MSLNILGFLSNIVSPVTDLIDNLHTSDEEKLLIKSQVIQLQNEMASKVLDYEQELMTARVSIITAEANGQSWIQRSWRPVTMLTFLVLVVLDSFGVLPNRLAGEAWTLLQLGLGGYVLGRSAEKVAPSIANAIKGDK